jgi:hypothetical protein
MTLRCASTDYAQSPRKLIETMFDSAGAILLLGWRFGSAVSLGLDRELLGTHGRH